ncbi:MAG: amidohydrolase family protein [Spirochaetota bacterium]
MDSLLFVDVHCHVFGLSHPDFLGYLEWLRHRRFEAIYSQVSSPNFVLASLVSKGGARFRNFLAVLERESEEILELIEDDLLGLFAKAGDPEALVQDGRLRIGDLEFSRILVVPLVIDFGRRQDFPTGNYYDRQPQKHVERQVDDLLEGIAAYRRSRPGGLLEIRPFLGVNTACRGMDDLCSILETSFQGWEPGEGDSTLTFASMAGCSSGNTPDVAFAGVKLYPPLGFDPWPVDGQERDKADFLFGFCERRGIPIVTHCDDQGLRSVPLEEAWTIGSPERWKEPLARHPELRVDFAHFGMRYANPKGEASERSWSRTIMAYMREYPGVYADISFNGCDPDYYPQLLELLESEDRGGVAIADRLLFGTDFPMSLLKSRSYSDYLRGFSDPGLPDELKLRLCSINPQRFLFGASASV